MLRRKLNALAIFVFFSIVSLVSFTFPEHSYAVVIFGDGLLGDFEGEMIYSPIDAESATLTIILENTSPAGNDGFLTAFAFNNPLNRITEITFSSTDPDFDLLGEPDFDNGINGAPNGQFDIGASTGARYQGGGNPQKGIAVGVTETFTFELAGTELDELTDNSFVSELSTGSGAREGFEFFVARFRGFEDGGSDKVPGNVIPEPTTLSLLGLGLMGLAKGLRKKDSNP